MRHPSFFHHFRSVGSSAVRLSLFLSGAAVPSAHAEFIAGLDGVSASSTFETGSTAGLPLEGWTAVDGTAQIYDSTGGNGSIIHTLDDPFGLFTAEYVPASPVAFLPNTRYTLRFDMGFIAGSAGGSAEYLFQLGTVTGGVFTGLGEPATGMVTGAGNMFSGPTISGSAEQIFDTGAAAPAGETLAVRWELLSYDGISDFFGFDNVTLDASPVPGPDVTPPVLVSAGGLGGQSIGIRFDEALDPASAAAAANYAVNAGITVTSATLLPNGSSVALGVTGLTNQAFTVTVNGVKDAAGNTITGGTVNGVPVNLTGQDIGFPVETGVSYSDAAGEIRIQAGGYDVWFGEDSFHFASQERTGNFDVRIQVTEFGPAAAHGSAKALLMARESLDADSRHVSVTVYPRSRNWVSYQRADTTGESSVLAGAPDAAWPEGVNYSNAWLRLRRVGETFTTYGSPDGEVWTQIGDPVTPENPYPSTIRLGLGVTSLGDQFPLSSPVATAAFRNFSDFSLGNVVISFTQQPASITVLEDRPATFTAAVEVTGTAAQNLDYQWLRNGVPIEGATGLTYTVPAATVDSGARYRLRASASVSEFELSEEAVLTVTEDTVPPAIVSANSVNSLGGQSISIAFSEPLDPDSALEFSHYTVTGGSVDEVMLREDGQSVILQVSGLTGSSFQLTVNGVTDPAMNLLNTAVQVQIQPWVIEEINAAGPPQQTFSGAPDSFDVTAAGLDIWKDADSFHFIHRPQTGDFDVSVQMARLDLVDGSARGGLMVREDLSPGSRNFFAGTYAPTGSNHWVGTTRNETGGDTGLNGYILREPSFAFPNAWFRMTRTGNTFTAYYSMNGADWTQLGDPWTPETPLPAAVYLGMATTSISIVPTTAHYRNFSSATAQAAPALDIVRSGQSVLISWPESAEGFTLHSTADLAAGPWTAVAGQPALVNGRYEITLPVEAGRRFYRLQK